MGQMIAAYQNNLTEILIAEDVGAYEGCAPDLNVRKLRTVEIISARAAHDTMRKIMARGNGYGTGWGSVGKLFPVNDDDISDLRSEAAATTAIEAARHIVDDHRFDVASRGVPPVCPHCGTHCYGDCQA